jgi:hypothetical protein
MKQDYQSKIGEEYGSFNKVIPYHEETEKVLGLCLTDLARERQKGN